MPNWTARDFSRDAAAAALNMNLGTLDLWLHRYKAPSGRKGKNRVFSLQDLTTLQTARQLLNPDILAPRAMEIAGRHMERPPDEDAVVIVTRDRDWLGTRADPWPEENCTIVNVGWVRMAIEKALEAPLWPFNKPAPVVETETKSLGDPTAELLELFGAIPAGTSISNAEALSVPAVSAAVRIISEAAASLDLKLKRKVGAAEEDVDDHAGLKLLTGQANSWCSGYELIRDLVAGALTKDTGALCYVTKVANQPRELIIYKDGLITVDEDDKTGEPKYRIGGQFASSKNIMRVRGPFMRSPLSMARSAIATASAMEGYANALWTNGAKVGGVIEVPGKLGGDGVKAMLAGWRAAYAGKLNAGKVGVLYEGAKYNQTALTSVDGEFTASRVFQNLEICRAFGLPPSMAYELERATWSNSEQASREFITWTLQPWTKVLEAAFNRTLLSDSERVDHRFAFDIDDTSQADLTARATAISTLITSKVLNPNEARDWLGMPPREGGDEFSNPAIDVSKPAGTPPPANENNPPEKEADDALPGR